MERLQLEQVAEDQFLGGGGLGSATVGDRLYGGLVAGQAVVAASLTVTGRELHSLHALFLRPGRADVPLVFEVDRQKSGRNYHVRQVTARQEGEPVFQASASFAPPMQGPTHAAPAPEAPAPESCPNRDQLRGRSGWEDLPIDLRLCDALTDAAAREPWQRMWMRLRDATRPDPPLQRALLVYASDRCLLETAWRPHADRGRLAGASLDHTMWFHAAPDLNDWLLYSMWSPAAAGERGLAFGWIHDRSGRLIASVAQEGVLRYHPVPKGT